MRKVLTDVLAIVARLGMGGLFVYAAWTKIQDPALFAEAVKSYDMLPEEFVGFFALTLPMAELLAGATLVFTKWSREAALVILGMLVMFLIGLTQAAVRGLSISCGCFGETGAEEGSSLGMTIVRDLLLMVPAVWLAFFRGNGWIWQRPGRVAAMAATALGMAVTVMGEASAPTTNTAPAAVAAEQWTTNFPAALQQAKTDRRPLIIVGGSGECKLCVRTEDIFANEVFSHWAKGSGIYLVNFHFDETNKHPHMVEAAQYLMNMPFRERSGIPYVGIYWPRGTNELRTAFTFRRNVDLGHDHASLMGKFILVVDDILADYFKDIEGRQSLEEILAATAKRISVACDGTGKVSISPEDGMLESGQEVTLTAKAGRRARFVGWRGPDGRMLKGGRSKRLTLHYKAAAGVYTAVFESF